MQIYKNFFGEKLRAALKSKEIKPVRLAEKLGINPSNVSKWLNGHDFPEEGRLPEICKVIGIEMSYFTEMHPAPAGPTNGALLAVNERLEKENEELRKTLLKIPPEYFARLAVRSARDVGARLAWAFLSNDISDLKETPLRIHLESVLQKAKVRNE